MLTDLTNLCPFISIIITIFALFNQLEMGSDRELPDAVKSIALLVHNCCRALYTCHRLQGSSLALPASILLPISLYTSDATIFGLLLILLSF